MDVAGVLALRRSILTATWASGDVVTRANPDAHFVCAGVGACGNCLVLTRASFKLRQQHVSSMVLGRRGGLGVPSLEDRMKGVPVLPKIDCLALALKRDWALMMVGGGDGGGD